MTLLVLSLLTFQVGTLLRVLRLVSKRIANPLTTRYWSTTPYQFGEGKAAKFLAVPDVIETELPADPSADSLRQAMAERLRAEDVYFDFKVQLQTDEHATPIEDATVEWPESIAPARTVARIKIPAQEFQSREQMAFGEDLSFTPWHAIVEHRPLGGVNRARKEVYRQISRLRHEINGTTSREPEADDPPVGPLSLAPEIATFDQVLDAELALIRERRRMVEGGNETPPAVDAPAGPDADALLMVKRVEVLDEHVTALSFSGGGIRAATFAVGIIQGLATLGLVRRFDYLSTVSGGGYAGAWLAAWLKRDGVPANVEAQLNPNRVAQSRADRAYLHDRVVDEEPEPLRHLRAYSSYMSPRPAPLSVDTWTVIMIWVRNVIINLLMLLPTAMLLVAAARLVVYLYGLFNTTWQGDDPREWLIVLPFLVIGAVLLGVAYVRNGAALREFRTANAAVRRFSGEGGVSDILTQRIVYPALIAVFGLTVSVRWVQARVVYWLDRPLDEIVTYVRWSLWNFGLVSERPEAAAFMDPNSPWRTPWDYLRSHLGPRDLPSFLLHALIFGGLLALGSLRLARRDHVAEPRRFVRAAFLAGVIGGVLLVLLEWLTEWFSTLGRPDLMATFVPPLALLILVVGLIVEVAALDRWVGEAEREWWARVGADLTVQALRWLAAAVTVLYGPALFLCAGPWVRTAIASGWLASAAFGVLTGHYVLPKFGGKALTLIASAASQAFLIGLLAAVALLGAAMLNVPSIGGPHGDIAGSFDYYLAGIKGTNLITLLALLLGSWVAFLLARRLIDVNLFSLHAMYSNRLTRAYLGASRVMKFWPNRWEGSHDPRMESGAPSLGHPPGAPVPSPRDANPVTGFDHRDDLDLADLLVGADRGGDGRRYFGPHLLINTTLNLVGGDDLAMRSRLGESFTLSPLYCGAKSVGYSLTEGTRGRLSLGNAVAISGAALDPNMSYYQSGPLTALLTLFNARLGYWIERPKATGWRAFSPKLGDLLFTEFFGRTNNRGPFLHLTDGGHFENLGVYELIRRRCRYIVAIASSSDSEPSDDDLAILIRLCRIDFGVRIRIETGPLKMTGPDRLTRAHAVVGTIHYDDVDQGEMPGVLVYIKTTLTGDEPPDIEKFAGDEPTFPCQATDLTQEFDEEQFECYRALGDHIARSVFGDAVDQVRALFPPGAFPPHKEYVPRLFSALQVRWSRTSRSRDEAAHQALSAWDDLQRDVSTRPELAGLSRELFPEVAPSATSKNDPDDIDPSRRDRAEIAAVGRMLDIAEETWLTLGLSRSAGLPMNRGWMNAFRRWTATSTFQHAWPVLRSTRGADFVRFCESQLHAAMAPPSAVRLAGEPAAESIEGRGLAELAAEFAREWPDDVREGRGLAELIRRAGLVGLDTPPVWLIEIAPSGPARAEDSPDRFVAGIILAAAFPDHPDREALDLAGKAPIELFVWVRPPHRSSGLAARTARQVVTTISDELLTPVNEIRPTLWARYPRATPGDDDQELSLWLSFFARYDFRRRYLQTPPARRPVTLLERRPR